MESTSFNTASRTPKWTMTSVAAVTFALTLPQLIVQIAVLANCVSTSVVAPAILGVLLVCAATLTFIVVEVTKKGSKRG